MSEFETIGARRYFYEENYGHSLKPNKNMTLLSLIAFFKLLEADNREDFCECYSVAFHDNNGGSVWNMIINTSKYDEVRKKRMREKYKKSEIQIDSVSFRTDHIGKRHWYNNGKDNRLFNLGENPEGWTIGKIGAWKNKNAWGTK